MGALVYFLLSLIRMCWYHWWILAKTMESMRQVQILDKTIIPFILMPLGKARISLLSFPAISKIVRQAWLSNFNGTTSLKEQLCNTNHLSTHHRPVCQAKSYYSLYLVHLEREGLLKGIPRESTCSILPN